MTDFILKVNNLNVSLNKIEIIRNLSFSLRRGDILTILGPNGSGKSVLLRTLLGFIPYTGTINWNKHVKIGYLPQGLTQLTIRSLPLSVRDFFILKDVHPKQVFSWFKRLNLEPKSIYNQQIGKLSGGQFQKILLAWALIKNPNVLILDEPTTGVDFLSQEKLYQLIHRLSEKKNLTIVLVTHDLNIIYKYSNNVLCLSHEVNCLLPTNKKLDTRFLEKLYGKPVKFYYHKR